MTIAGGEGRFRWFVAWAAPGVCFAFGVTALGVFTVPLGALLLVALASRRWGAATLGLLAGVGVTVTGIGSIHRNYQACSGARTSAYLAPGGTGSVSYSCGGVDGVHWMIVGITLTVIALVLYLWRRHI